MRFHHLAALTLLSASSTHAWWFNPFDVIRDFLMGHPTQSIHEWAQEIDSIAKTFQSLKKKLPASCLDAKGLSVLTHAIDIEEFHRLHISQTPPECDWLSYNCAQFDPYAEIYHTSFGQACNRLDFGYRNSRVLGLLDAAQRVRLDSQFRIDVRYLCEVNRKNIGLGSVDCEQVSLIMYHQAVLRGDGNIHMEKMGGRTMARVTTEYEGRNVSATLPFPPSYNMTHMIVYKGPGLHTASNVSVNTPKDLDLAPKVVPVEKIKGWRWDKNATHVYTMIPVAKNGYTTKPFGKPTPRPKPSKTGAGAGAGDAVMENFVPSSTASEFLSEKPYEVLSTKTSSLASTTPAIYKTKTSGLSSTSTPVETTTSTFIFDDDQGKAVHT